MQNKQTWAWAEHLKIAYEHIKNMKAEEKVAVKANRKCFLQAGWKAKEQQGKGWIRCCGQHNNFPSTLNLLSSSSPLLVFFSRWKFAKYEKTVFQADWGKLTLSLVQNFSSKPFCATSTTPLELYLFSSIPKCSFTVVISSHITLQYTFSSSSIQNITQNSLTIFFSMYDRLT